MQILNMVKPLYLWNQAAFMKHIWELIQEKQILWAIWVTKIKSKGSVFGELPKQLIMLGVGGIYSS